MTKAERTRQFIIEKTAPIFNIKGYAGTSINDMIDATGLTKGAIYGNFGNKDEVAVAAFEYNFANVTRYIASRIHERASAIDKLLVYPETHRQVLDLPFLEGGCPVLNTSVDADDTHPALRDKVVLALERWRNSIIHIINKGIEQGEINPATDPRAMAAIMISITEGAVMQAKLTGKTTDLHTAMDFMVKLIHDLKT